MPVSSCPHARSEEPYRACSHLIAKHDGDYLRCFTGVGQHYDVACRECSQAEGDVQSRLGPVCAWCFSDIESEGCWDGIVGRPAVVERRTSMLFSSRTVLTATLSAAITAIHGYRDGGGHAWLALCADGMLVRIAADSWTHTAVASLVGSALDLSTKIVVAVCHEGRFASLVNAHGQHGLVIDLTTGRQTMSLLRDDYHNQHCHFAATFAIHAGRTILIHATAWNRLDISAPDTGTLLTAREHEATAKDESPTHALDYFHGRVLVSPDQQWIVDDGWVWHPVGILTAWRLDHWLEVNVWESENGPSLVSLADAFYFWGAPMCWISDHELVVWGYGGDDEWMIPAVRVIDLTLGKEIRWFAGPEIASRTEGYQVLEPNPPRYKRMVFDRYLFAFSPLTGVAVWEMETGTCVLRSDWFTPDSYHRGTREFASLVVDGVRLTRLVGG